MIISIDSAHAFCYNDQLLHHTHTHMKRLHTLLVTAYLVLGLTLIVTTPFGNLRGQLVTHGGGAVLMKMSTDETLHSAADATVLQTDVTLAYARAAAARQLMLGILIFTLGGFIHAYQVLREERPVHITVKKRRQQLLYWLEMKV